MIAKTQKELAFLHDLYIAPDWGERFAELVDEHVKPPREGRALYVAATTGGHAMAFQERAGYKLELLCVDENAECIELARAKASALHEKSIFQREGPDALSFRDNQFDLVLGNFSFRQPVNVRSMLAELVRVAKPGATVAWWLPTASSFGEFFSIYWEALHNAGSNDLGLEVEHLITDLPTVSGAENWAEDAGLEKIDSWTAIEEFDFESGEQFLSAPLVSDFLLPNWLALLPEAGQTRVIEELSKIIDEERHRGEFSLTLKATLIVGKKARVQ
jgi:hypothetical protein